MSMTYRTCAVCGGKDWLELPLSHSGRSVRSDGAVLNATMHKAQCAGCGLVQAISLPDAETLATLYSSEYDIYNNRPASEQFVMGRYTALAHAITSSVAPFKPKKVLEVGCGNGAALAAIQSVWNEAACIGVEPVTSAVESAQTQGIGVHQGMIGGVLPEVVTAHKYDVIYTIHVIEHTDDPVAFLSELKSMLAPQGRLIVTCPNARVPNLEVMRSDHHYSMTPYHLNMLARRAGLLPVRSTLCPGGGKDLDYEYNQLLVCCLPETADDIDLEFPLPGYLQEANRLQLFGARCKYFHDFASLDAFLLHRMNGHKRVICFGTGGWACILAGYAPTLWQHVEACVIDGGSNRTFFGKPILSYDRLKESEPDTVVTGVNPAIQPMIALRLAKDGYRSLRWDDLITM